MERSLWKGKIKKKPKNKFDLIEVEIKIRTSYFVHEVQGLPHNMNLISYFSRTLKSRFARSGDSNPTL